MRNSAGQPREKRPNGRGGIWYSSTEGRWRAQYTDLQGQTRYLSSKTKAEVTRKLDEETAKRDAGVLGGLPSRTPTVGQWLDHWFEAKDNLKPRSRERHESDIDRRVPAPARHQEPAPQRGSLRCHAHLARYDPFAIARNRTFREGREPLCGLDGDRQVSAVR